MQHAAGAYQGRLQTRVHVKIYDRAGGVLTEGLEDRRDAHEEAGIMAGPGGGGAPRQ